MPTLGAMYLFYVFFFISLQRRFGTDLAPTTLITGCFVSIVRKWLSISHFEWRDRLAFCAQVILSTISTPLFHHHKPDAPAINLTHLPASAAPFAIQGMTIPNVMVSTLGMFEFGQASETRRCAFMVHYPEKRVKRA